MIDRAPLPVKQAMPPVVFLYAVAVLVWIKIDATKRVHRQLQMRSDRCDLGIADVNGAGVAGAAVAAPKALEVKPVIKKIGAAGILFRKMGCHDLFVSDSNLEFKSYNPFNSMKQIQVHAKSGLKYTLLRTDILCNG